MMQEMSANDSITPADPVLLQSSPVQQGEAEQNVSSAKGQGNGPGHYAAVVLMVGVSCLAVAGNACNLLVVVRTKHLRRVLSNFFVLSLCTCDLLASLLVMPAAASAFASGAWLLGDTACRAAGFMGAWLTFVSVATVSLISAERFYCLRWVMHHEVFMTFQKTLGVALLVWAWGALMAALPLAGINSYDYRPSLCNCSFAAKPEAGHVTYVILVTTLFFLVPGAVVVVMYAGIFRVARQAALQVEPLPLGLITKVTDREPVATQTHSTAASPAPAWTVTRSSVSHVTSVTTSAASLPSTTSKASGPAQTAEVKATASSNLPPPEPHPKRSGLALLNIQKQRTVRGHMKAAKTVLLLVISFLVLWGPLFTLHLHSAIRPSSSLMSNAGLAAQWLGFSSFAVNPLLYGWMNAAIREELVVACRLLCCWWCWLSRRCCKFLSRKDVSGEETEGGEGEKEERLWGGGGGVEEGPPDENLDFLQFLKHTSRTSQLTSHDHVQRQTSPGDRRDTCQVPPRDRRETCVAPAKDCQNTSQAPPASDPHVEIIMENTKPSDENSIRAGENVS